jgi:hypothetical protein
MKQLYQAEQFYFPFFADYLTVKERLLKMTAKHDDLIIQEIEKTCWVRAAQDLPDYG